MQEAFVKAYAALGSAASGRAVPAVVPAGSWPTRPQPAPRSGAGAPPASTARGCGPSRWSWPGPTTRPTPCSQPNGRRSSCAGSRPLRPAPPGRDLPLPARPRRGRDRSRPRLAARHRQLTAPPGPCTACRQTWLPYPTRPAMELTHHDRPRHPRPRPRPAGSATAVPGPSAGLETAVRQRVATLPTQPRPGRSGGSGAWSRLGSRWRGRVAVAVVAVLVACWPRRPCGPPWPTGSGSRASSSSAARSTPRTRRHRRRSKHEMTVAEAAGHGRLRPAGARGARRARRGGRLRPTG